MQDILHPLLLFSLKGLTVFLLIAGILLLLTFLLVSTRKAPTGTLSIELLNDEITHYRQVLQEFTLEKKEFKSELKKTKAEKKAAEKNSKKGATDKKPNAYVLDFDGDLRASAVESLRQEITALLTILENNDEVVVRLESPGGMVTHYGLAASQLQRLRDRHIPLTACVDKVAASGGYMMACVANKILAAPFAIVGSIGVVAQVPNFHKVLDKHDIDYREITAGEYKRTIGMFTKITEDGLKKFTEQIQDTHELFKDHVKRNRESLNLAKVATGEYWYGHQAVDLGLIDQIQTSDDYLMQLTQTKNVYKIKYAAKKKFLDRVSESMSSALVRSLDKLLQLTLRMPTL